MILNIQKKQKIITEINEISKNALSAIIVNCCGVTVNKMTELRKACRETDVYIRVVRNTLLYQAIKGTIFECLKDMLHGPTLIAYSMKQPNAAARLFVEFMKTDAKFVIKAAALEGKLISALQIDYLATLPTYKEAVMHLIAIIKEISIGKLIRTLIVIGHMKKFV